MVTVGARVIGFIEHTCARRGIDYRALTAGLSGLDQPRVPWASVVTLLERLEVALGGPRVLEDEGRLSNSSPVFAPFRSVVATLAGSHLLYKAVVVWFGPELVPFIRSTYERLADNRVRIEMAIPDEVAGSEAFFRYTLGSYRGLPGILGYPEARVEATISARSAVYFITPPAQRTLLSRLRHAAIAFANSPRLLDELGKQQRELGENYFALLEKTGSLEKEIAERRRAEEALRVSRDELATTLQSIGDAVIATDTAGRIARMNAVAEELTGWPFTEAVGRPLSEVFRIINEDTREPSQSPVERVLRENRIVGLANHTALIARDGSERTIADSGAPIRGADGSVQGVVLVFRDHTEQRKARHAIEQSEARFRRLAESGIIGVIVSNRAGVITEANDAFLEMVGYSRDDLVAGRVGRHSLVPPEGSASNSQARAEIAARGSVLRAEVEFVRKDGQRVQAMVGGALLDKASGEVLSVIQDLTARRAAERSMRESHAQKTAVLEAALDAIVLMNHQGAVTEFNAAAERMFGYSRAEAIGQQLAELIVPHALRDAHQLGLARYLSTGKHQVIGKRIELNAMRRDGTEFPSEIAIVRIQSDGPALFTGYIRDISERRRAAEAETLRRAKNAAEHANSELEAFSYSVAHDLRAPLRAVSGFSTTLLEDYSEVLDAAGRAQLGRIISGTARMGHLIDALLGLARISRTELHREPVDLTRLAQHVFAQLASAEPSRSVEFIAADAMTTTGDPHLIRSLLENLLGNSFKFTRPQPAARIELGFENGAYFIRDNGTGFDMAHVQKLFAPFRRLHTEKQFEGTGIGLATVHRIVRRHGGRIWAESDEGQGAVFRFTLTPESNQ